jgi:two-component system nitrate/nitrite response regulator NarL
MTADGALRVLVVDDHDLFRTGLRALLEEEGLVVTDAPSGKAAMRIVKAFQPDVVLMDVNMPGMSGTEATERLCDAMPRASVVMLSITQDAETIVEAVRAGASGYLLKDTPFDDIVAGIHAAAAGESVLGPAAARALVERLQEDAPSTAEEPAALPELSDREREVLVLLARGCDNPTIGSRLFMSPSTVKHHVSRILQKLGVENRLQAAAFAIRHGWADNGGGRG